jgi:hypothetical protein
MFYRLRGVIGPESDNPTGQRLAAIFLLLGVAVAITSIPLRQMGWVSDDFSYLSLIHFTAERTLPQGNLSAWWADFVHWSLNDLVDGVFVIRPIRMWSMWADYFVWYLQPFGYHLTGLLLHLGTSFAMFLVGWQLTRNQLTGFLAALFFAILPIHSSDMAWVAARYHLLCGLFFGLSLCFYLKRRRPALYVMSLVMSAGAILSNEAGVILPLVLVAYEIVYHGHEPGFARRTVGSLLPFFAIVIAYVGLRFLLNGQAGPPGYSWFDNLALAYKFAGYVMFVTDPLLTNITYEQALLGAVFLLVLFGLYHSRREVVFGSAWMLVTILGFIPLPVEERYFYIPSMGLTLALVSILANPIVRFPDLSRWLQAALVLGLVVAYGTALYSRDENWRNASRITERVVSQVKRLHPILPSGARLVFVGVPQRLRRAFVFLTGLEPAMQLAFDDPSLHASLVESFPILTDDLGKTYFFEYDNNRIQERVDLVDDLRARRTCLGGAPAIVWRFATDAQGWEAWSDLANFGIRDGGLEMKVSGANPMIGGPVIEVARQQFAGVQLTMSARAPTPHLQGTLYWQTANMSDFSPAFNRPFTIQADGVTHTYDLRFDNPGSSLEAKVVRLRIDPGNTPADIRIDSISVLCKP